MRLGHTIVPAYDKVKSSIFLVKGHEAQGDLVGSQVFDVSGDGPLVVVGVGDAGEIGRRRTCWRVQQRPFVTEARTLPSRMALRRPV